jgi:hypothetical protein
MAIEHLPPGLAPGGEKGVMALPDTPPAFAQALRQGKPDLRILLIACPEAGQTKPGLAAQFRDAARNVAAGNGLEVCIANPENVVPHAMPRDRAPGRQAAECLVSRDRRALTARPRCVRRGSGAAE